MGFTRNGCQRKIVYVTLEAAEERVREEAPEVTLRIYPCGLHYHVTKQPMTMRYLKHNLTAKI